MTLKLSFTLRRFCSNLATKKNFNELNKDLQKIAEWVHQSKMSFDPDLNKQDQEVIFSRKND